MRIELIVIVIALITCFAELLIGFLYAFTYNNNEKSV